MANTGYIINPQLIQVFTSGPNSGSLVSSSFVTIFDSGSNFTTASFCGNFYYNKIFDPISCGIPDYCIPPSIISINPIFCGSEYNYQYNLSYNINGNYLDIPNSKIEYSLNNSFAGEIQSRSLNNPSNINSTSINISNLSTLPLNSSTPVYFRMKNICSGSESNSLYTNIISSSCTSISYGFNFSEFWEINAELSCGNNTFPKVLYSNNNILEIGSQLYNNIGLTLVFNGKNSWFKNNISSKSYRISNMGIVLEISDCNNIYCYTIYEEIGESINIECLSTPYTITNAKTVIQLKDLSGNPIIATQDYIFSARYYNDSCYFSPTEEIIDIPIYAGNSSGSFSYVTTNWVDCGQGSCEEELTQLIGINSTPSELPNIIECPA